MRASADVRAKEMCEINLILLMLIENINIFNDAANAFRLVV